MKEHYDVAIIGGGPGGSTTGALIKKYAPHLSVAIFEREQFPREHVGESQLPPISAVLDEMGVFDKVEAANFPIKIGATYRWGQSEKLWDFEFIPLPAYVPQERPRKYEGQVREIAFQVERAIYDEILLNHAKELGCEVFMPAKVTQIGSDGDRVTHLEIDQDKHVTATHYVDASGNSGILRRNMGVGINSPTTLQNVAFWDYWTNTEWASKFDGGATRVLVMSIGCGWIWYIPLGPTRTSIGFVCPAQFYKTQGKSPKEMYDFAISQEPLIAELTANATRDNDVRSTRDWSYVAERLTGENWFLVGETAGFADPILAAGLTLTHTGARELAYTLVALEEGSHDKQWLKEAYESNQINRVRQHIRFADFWYAGNGIFTDLQEFTRTIAADAGLELNAQDAFRWLGTGGFTHDNPAQVGIGGLDLAGARQVAQILFDDDFKWNISKYSSFKLNLDYAQEITIPGYQDGKIMRIKAYKRDSKVLAMAGLYEVVADLTKVKVDALKFQADLESYCKYKVPADLRDFMLKQAIQVLEVMIGEGWVIGKTEMSKPKLIAGSPRQGQLIHDNVETNERIANLAKGEDT